MRNGSTSTAADASKVRWADVELGPPLPMAVYTCTEAWNPERIGAMAIYCSDGRWGEAFDEFCHQRLLLPRYDRWAVAGGPQCLVRREQNRVLYEAARAQIELLVRVHGLGRIVLITHYGCAVYRELLQQPPDTCITTQIGDLRSARDTLREWFPEVQVDTYLAMQRGRCLSFHEVNY